MSAQYPVRAVCFATENDCVSAGPLPKVLPTSLEVLDVSGGVYSPHKFTGGIPSEWGTLTNLKELKLAYCGLDGKPLSTRTELFQNTRLFYSSLHRPYPCRAFRLGQFKGAETLLQQVDR